MPGAQQQPTAITYAQNALFFSLFSLFVAFAVTVAWVGLGHGTQPLRSMPKPNALRWIGRIYAWAWLCSTCILTSLRFVRLFVHGKRAKAATAASVSSRTPDQVAAWTGTWFIGGTHYLKAGDRVLYTLARHGSNVRMHSEEIQLEMAPAFVVVDRRTGQCLAEADLNPEWRLTTDPVISGNIRTADSTTYRVTGSAHEAMVLAQAGSRFLCVQGPGMVVRTNQDLADAQVAAVCLILSSFLILGGPSHTP